MLTEHDGNVTYEWDVPNNAPNNLLLTVEIPLSTGVQLDIVGIVVVALCEEVKGSFPTNGCQRSIHL